MDRWAWEQLRPDKANARRFAVTVAIMDKGYDGDPMHQHVMRAVRRLSGSDYKRKAAKWRCPTGACQPGSIWVKATPAAPAHPARVQAVR